MDTLPLVSGHHSMVDDSEYRDDGCDAHPSCLSCPFIVCRDDLPNAGIRVLRVLTDHQKILDLTRSGSPVGGVAETTGYSVRQVYRILKRYGDRNVSDVLTTLISTK